MEKTNEMLDKIIKNILFKPENSQSILMQETLHSLLKY